MKKVLRKAVAASLMVLTGPIVAGTMVACGVSLGLKDPNEWLFFQKRVGKDGKPFNIVKIRTANNGHLTQLTSIVRTLHIDELPQLINIFDGDMAFIGPRPIVQNEFDVYCRVIKGARLRHSILPGLTGLSQVLIDEKESISSFFERCRVDIEYVRLTGMDKFKTDIFVLFKTIEYLLFGVWKRV